MKFLLSGNAVFHWKISGTIFFSTLADRVAPELEFLFHMALFLLISPPFSQNVPVALRLAMPRRGSKGAHSAFSAQGCSSSPDNGVILWFPGVGMKPPKQFLIYFFGLKCRVTQMTAGSCGLSSRLSSRHHPGSAGSNSSRTHHQAAPMPSLSHALSLKKHQDLHLKCHDSMARVQVVPLLLSH